MNKKIWEKPEVKILDVKRDTKIVAYCNPSGGNEPWKPHKPGKPHKPHKPWWPWWPW